MAMTITAVSLTLLFVIQGRLVQQSARALESWHAMVALKNIFVVSTEKKEQRDATVEKIVDAVTVSYALKKPSEQSSLKKMKQVQLMQGAARWSIFGVERRELLLGAMVSAKKEAAA